MMTCMEHITSMLWSHLCGYSDAYILMSGNITIVEVEACGRNDDLEVVFKNCAPFTDCISKIGNT